MIQAPRKSNGIELGYEQAFSAEVSGVRRVVTPSLAASAADGDPEALAEIERLHQQLRQVREWADRGEWRESGSDGLYAILSEAKR